MENVIAGVMGAGINRDEISTSSLKVYPVYGDYDYDKNESPIVGFRAENIILIETTRLEEYAKHAKKSKFRCNIAGAGGAANLPGMIAHLQTCQ